jgi:DNA-binding SARP family transcriptional activator
LTTTRPTIDRPRLLAVLAGRFERRLTVVVGGPGFGKTAVLASAMADNELQPHGADVWLQCRPADADADELATRLLGAMGQDGPPTPSAVADAVWSRAPSDVVLVLDDVHELAPGSSGEQLIADLVGELPRNGHLLVAGRRALRLPTAALRLSNDVALLGEGDLAFDDEEIERFAVERHVDAGLVAAVRWPALAELVVIAGHEAAAEYLCDEVLDRLDPARLEMITQLALFATIDDELVRAVTDSDQTAERLLSDLPLTVREPDGALRLHALWEPVLRSRLDRETELRVLARGAEHLLQRGDIREAFDASRAAGDADGQRAAVMSAIAKPLVQTYIGDLRYLADRLPSRPEFEVDAALLGAIIALEGDEATAVERLDEAAAIARTRGESDLECIALWRLYQSELWASDDERLSPIIDRTADLANEGVPLARVLVDIQRSVALGRAGRRDDALRTLRECEARSTAEALAQTVDLRHGVLVDLGCPEEIGAGLADEQVAELTDSATQVVAVYAAWLRGDVPADLAFEVGKEVEVGLVDHRLAYQRVVLSGVLAVIAVHAGELETAGRYLEHGKQFVGHVVSGHAANILRVADAALAAAECDEGRASALLEQALLDVPIGVLPARCYLNSLPLLHVLVPRARGAIDEASLGPALTAVQAMARALTATREHADVDLAAALPWQRVDLLRAHVVPPHVAELAVAALVGGAVDAEAVLQGLPNLRDQLRSVAARHDGPIGDLARVRLATLPARPSYAVRIELLGGVELSRNGVRVVEKSWNRERVRQILCYLLIHSRTTRSGIMEALWPALDERSASANLRTNLGHLRRLLEPDRDQGEASWFVRSDQEMLLLCTDGLETDVARFDSLVAEGRRFEERGVPGSALASYLDAIDLYHGDYAAGLDEPWLTYERIRLRSAFATAATRAGELLLARGEPEQALRHADVVTSHDELAENAHRLRVRSLLAIGDRSAARASGARLLEVLADAGLSAEIETQRLLDPLGLSS